MDRTGPAGAALLLDFIGGIEAPRGYDVIYGNNQDKLPKSITQMTLGELIDAQASFTKRFKPSPSGRYQFMRANLQDLSRELGLRGTQMFDKDPQDRLAFHLLRRCGYDDHVSGKITCTEFGKRLEQEWASLPVLAAINGARAVMLSAVQPVVVVPEVVTVEKPVVAHPGELGTKPSKTPGRNWGDDFSPITLARRGARRALPGWHQFYLLGKQDGRLQTVSEQLRETIKAEKESGGDDEKLRGLTNLDFCVLALRRHRLSADLRSARGWLPGRPANALSKCHSFPITSR